MPDDESETVGNEIDGAEETEPTDEVSGYGLSLNPGLVVKDPMDDWIKESWASNFARKDGSLDADDYDPHHHKP